MEWIALVVGILGIFGRREISRTFQRTIGKWWLLRTWSRDRVQKELLGLVRDHTVQFKSPQNVATFGDPVCVQYFVDLLSVATTEEGQALLERCALRWLKLHSLLPVDKIAAPKLGNVLFAASVSRALSIPLVIVRQDEEQIIREGHPLEGKLASDDKVLLVDDIASDGNFLANCVPQLEKYGARVTALFCLISRTEGNAARLVTSLGIPFEYILELCDSDLSDIQGKIPPSDSLHDHGNRPSTN